MTIIQKRLFAIYFSISAVLIFLDHILFTSDSILYIKYAIMLSLCLVVQIIHKESKEQRILAKSYLFMVLGDFCLVFSKAWDIDVDLNSFGLISFTIAYVIMIFVYKKYFVVKKLQILAGICIYGVFASQIVRLYSNMTTVVLVAGIVFAVIICTMTWMAVSIFFQKSFSNRNSFLVAVSGILMLICDLGVALKMFDHSISAEFRPYLNNIIWTAYVPGWTILAGVILDKKLFE